jgi:hypothetical protein
LVAYNAATACRSVNEAWERARNVSGESLVLVRSDLGAYPAYTLTGTRTSTNRVTFDAYPSSQRVLVNERIRIGQGETASLAPRYVTIKNVEASRIGQSGAANGGHPESRWPLLIMDGPQHIRVENSTYGGFLLRAAQNVEIIGGSSGPCYRVGTNGGSVGPCQINYILGHPGQQQAKNFLIDGVDFHDFNYYTPGGCTGACHHRSAYWAQVVGLTVRNSTFRNSVFEPWFTISCGDQTVFGACSVGNKDILIENNYFGAPVHTVGHGFSFAWCQNYGGYAYPPPPGFEGASAPYENVTFRFNSFARGVTVAVPKSNNPTGEANCVSKNFKVYGNIFGCRHPGCNNDSSVQWSYNVYAGTPTTGTCGVGDVNIGGTTMPFYKNDTTNPISRDDFTLVGGAFAGDNRVPIASGCPAVDRLAISRPQNSSFCDAGAHER